MQVKVKKRREFNRDYIPVIFCGILLVLMIAALFVLLKNNNKLNTDIPDVKKIDKIELLYSDFSDGIADKNDLLSAQKKEFKVDMNTIDNYANKGIIIDDSKYEYINNNFVVYSNRYSEQLFISQFSNDIDFITKIPKTINKKKYNETFISNVLNYNDKYYVFINGINSEDNIDNIVIKINNKGKIEDTKIIESHSTMEIVASNIIGNNIMFITKNERTLNIYYINEELNNTNDVYKMDDDNNNPFEIGQVKYLGYQLTSDKIEILIKRKVYQENTNLKYRLYVVPSNKDAEWVPVLSEVEYREEYDEESFVNKVKEYSTDYDEINLVRGGVQYRFGNILKNYDIHNKLHNTLDYNEVNTGLKNTLNEQEYDLKLNIKEIYKQDFYFIVLSEVDEKICVVDIYNENMDLIKRYQFDFAIFYPKASSLIHIYYDNNNLILIYNYGYKDTGIITYKVGEVI